MDLRQKPTLLDLAKLLDTIGTGLDSGYPETLHVLRCLIPSSPAALAIHDRLHARRDRQPSLIELARLMLAVEGHERYPEAVYTVNWLIARSEKAAELYRQLEQLADDAGFVDRDRDWAIEALGVNREVDRLLATLDEWRDAADEIQLDGPREDAFQHLVAVCRARITRCAGEERARLERLRRRLVEAARRGSRIRDPEEELSELEDSLRSMRDPAAALATVEGLSGRRRRR